jgi:hypothetical protein
MTDTAADRARLDRIVASRQPRRVEVGVFVAATDHEADFNWMAEKVRAGIAAREALARVTEACDEASPMGWAQTQMYVVDVRRAVTGEA